MSFNWIGSKLKGLQHLGTKVLDGASWLGHKVSDAANTAADWAQDVPLLNDFASDSIGAVRTIGALANELAKGASSGADFIRDPSREGAPKPLGGFAMSTKAVGDPMNYFHSTALQNIPKRRK